jgi:hypothetical protein
LVHRFHLVCQSGCDLGALGDKYVLWHTAHRCGRVRRRAACRRIRSHTALQMANSVAQGTGLCRHGGAKDASRPSLMDAIHPINQSRLVHLVRPSLLLGVSTERIRSERRRPLSADRRAEASANYEDLRLECVVLVS